MFYEYQYLMRIAYMIFLVITILSLIFLLWLLIDRKREKKYIFVFSSLLLGLFIIYIILLDDHIVPIDAIDWVGHKTPLPMPMLFVITAIIFLITAIAIIRTNKEYKKIVSERTIKEAIDEIPIAVCCFKKDGIPMLCNRMMQDISDIMSGKIFMSYPELKEMLKEKEDWKEAEDIFHFPNGRTYRYAEEELITRDGESYLVSNFFDITDFVRKKAELESQNEELKKMSISLLKLRENVELLAKEEEILSIKAKWHDVMGEGIRTIRTALLSNGPQKEMDLALKRWSDSLTNIKNESYFQEEGRDCLANLLRDAKELQVELIIDGEMPVKKQIQEVFILAIRNCLLNAIEHAAASAVYVEIKKTKEADILSISNNGNKPVGEIIPQGGLVNVKKYAERIGGQVYIESKPCFVFKLIVPEKELYKNDSSYCS